MELSEFLALTDKFGDLKKKIVADTTARDTFIYLGQYDPLLHDVMLTAKRPDKQVETDNGTSTVSVARLPIAYQKKIVLTRATFLCGNPVEIIAQANQQIEEDMLAVLKRTWDDNKLDYESKRLAKHMMSETEVAEVWYADPIENGYWKDTANDLPSVKYRLRMKIIAPSLGDTLYPIFDNKGDMIAFARGYKLHENEKDVEHFDIYTETKIMKGVQITVDTWEVTTEVNPLGKIPVIYYSQPHPEWYDVEKLIERTETLHSNHADTNDYFGSPMVFVQGDVTGFAKKGESGKVLIGKNGATANYLSWDSSPASIKLESDTLDDYIHYMTGTPKISFENLKGIGAVSGIALKLMFMDAHMYAADKEEDFGKGIQRRLNFLKTALAKINTTLEAATSMSIKPKFTYYLPQNVEETISTLMQATGGKQILSVESAVEQNPLVVDKDEELTRLQSDQSVSLTLPQLQ